MSEFSIAIADGDVVDTLADLAAEAAAHEIANVRRLIERWRAGVETYDAPGELVLVARANDEPIGVGGVAECPDVPGALRVRRFYVAIDWRRRGVATALAQQLIAHAGRHSDVITCNAQASAAAPVFWEALGFAATDVAGITHVLRP